MEVFYNRSDIEKRLTSAFQSRYKRKDAALTGILLARPEDNVAKELVLPNLEYWHYRSDFYADFFCAGYTPTELVSTAKPVGVTIEGLEWGFSLPAFVEIVELLEREAHWKYEGDTCLLLLSSYFDGQNARLDFRRCLRLNLREALEDKAIATPTQLVDQIFEIAKQINMGDGDPVWELSDKLGYKVIRSGIKDVLLSLLPSWLAPSTRKALHFAVHQHAGDA
jgi:hypothetical protein